MSTSSGARTAARTARTGTRTSTQAALRVVPPRMAAPGRAFVVLLVGVLAAGLVGLLVLNTAMQRAAFRLESLSADADRLEMRRQVLDLQVDRMGSPEVLARRATELGMVQMTTPVFLRLSDGTVLGDPHPAVAGIAPPMVPPAGFEATPPQRPRGDAR